MNHPIMFLDRDNKTKLVPASFTYFIFNFYEKKINFSLKNVLVIIVIIFLHYKETNEIVLIKLLLQKSS